MKRGSNKGKEPVIDVNDPSPRPKRTRSPSRVYDPHKFRSYFAFQTHENYFKDATPLVERAIDQPSLRETNILIWFATKDWNFLLSDRDVAYMNMVREFYANAIVEGDELKCWVKGKSLSMSPVYLAEILHINRPMLATTPVYNDLNPDKDLLWETLGRNLKFSQIRNSISVSSLSPELRVLTIIMFHNLYPLYSTGYMNLGRTLFLHDLISDEEIDIYAHIFHLLCKTVLRTNSRECIPFYCLISRILKLKGVHPSDNDREALGGANDPDALVYSIRMVGHPNVSLTVVQFIVWGYKTNSYQENLDKEMLNELWASIVGERRIYYKKETVRHGLDTRHVIHKMADNFDPVIVGEYHEPDSPVTLRLREWGESPELGVLGDMLASSVFQFSVLVVQQQPRR